MSGLRISSGGHEVEVQHDGADLSYVIEKAQKLWEETRPPAPEDGPAYGFQAQTKTGNGGPAYFRYGERPEVTS